MDMSVNVRLFFWAMVAMGVFAGGGVRATAPLQTEDWEILPSDTSRVEISSELGLGAKSGTAHSFTTTIGRRLSERMDLGVSMNYATYPVFKPGHMEVAGRFLAIPSSVLRAGIPMTISGVLDVERGVTGIGGVWGYEVSAVSGWAWRDLVFRVNAGWERSGGVGRLLARGAVEVYYLRSVVFVYEAIVRTGREWFQVGARWRATESTFGDAGVDLWRESGEWLTMIRCGATTTIGPK